MGFKASLDVRYKIRRIVRDRLFTRLLEEIEKSQGKITVASATLELVGAKGTPTIELVGKRAGS